MRISISNIAWNPDEDEAVAALLQKHGVDAIDVAPGKYFQDIEGVSDAEVLKVRQWWADRGVEIIGMQSLLYGTTGLNIFGDAAVRQATLDRLRAVFRIGALLGARKLVFGSPKNRDRTGLTDQQALETAVSFFTDVAELARKAGVTLCLEANPTRYGCNFMTTTAEAAEVVRLIDRPTLRLQLDTGTIIVNDEVPEETIKRMHDIVGHIHLSGPDIQPLQGNNETHRRIGVSLSRSFKNWVATVEILRSEIAALDSIHKSLIFAQHHYH